VILGVGILAEDWYCRRKFKKRLKDILREHLSDERWQWRSFDALRRAIHADAESTRELLFDIGARPSESDKDVWTLKK